MWDLVWPYVGCGPLLIDSSLLLPALSVELSGASIVSGGCFSPSLLPDILVKRAFAALNHVHVTQTTFL